VPGDGAVMAPRKGDARDDDATHVGACTSRNRPRPCDGAAEPEVLDVAGVAGGIRATFGAPPVGAPMTADSLNLLLLHDKPLLGFPGSQLIQWRPSWIRP
jgi:hypothetical protein